MKRLFIVTEVPKKKEYPSYYYVVKAETYDEAIQKVKNKVGHLTWQYYAYLAYNEEIWE